MTSKHNLLTIVILGSLLVIIPSIQAIGLGMYGGFSTGVVDLEWDHYNDFGGFAGDDLEGDSRSAGFGFVLDTAVAKDRVFNYRFNLTLSSIEYDDFDDHTGQYDFELNQFSMDHTFGFGVLRSKVARVWIGPQLRFAFLSGDISRPYDHYREDLDHAFGFGGGLVLGVNFHAGEIVSFCLDSGFRTTLYYGEVDRHEFWDEGSDDISGVGGEFFINFSVLFRMADVYTMTF